MNNKLKIFLGIFGIAILAGVLGFAVWRVQSQRTTITRPKAAGGAGQCKPSSQTHLECVNNSCAHVLGVGGNQGGCTAVGAACSSGTIPNCSNLTGPTTLTVGQTGTYGATFSLPSGAPAGNLGATVAYGQNGNADWMNGNRSLPGTSGTANFTWIPTAAGTYDVFCIAWNDSIAECRGKSNYVDGPPRYACTGPTSSMTVTVTTAAVGQCLLPSQTHFECVNNSCVRKIGAGSNQGGCTTSGASCGGITCTGSTPDLCGTTCTNKQTDVANCGICGRACTTGQNCIVGACVTPTVYYSCQNRTCAVATGASANANGCTTTGGTCCATATGVCPGGGNQANECEVCEGFAGKLCVTGLTCKKVSGAGADQGGICVKADGSSVCGACTNDSNCTPPLVCAEGVCADQIHLGCGTSSTCIWKKGAGSNTENCTVLGGTCTITGSSEANICWGNGGANGKCYDCNGDGVINVLDFSCFRKRYGNTITP